MNSLFNEYCLTKSSPTEIKLCQEDLKLVGKGRTSFTPFSAMDKVKQAFALYPDKTPHCEKAMAIRVKLLEVDNGVC